MALTALIFFTMVCRSREVSLWKTNLPDLATQVIISGVRLLHWSGEEGRVWYVEVGKVCVWRVWCVESECVEGGNVSGESVCVGGPCPDGN